MATTTAPEPQQPQQQQKESRKTSVRQELRTNTDRMWLETILKEKKAQSDWERKWGFILDLQKEFDEKLSKLPRPRHRMNKDKEFKTKITVDVLPSPPFPTTSSAAVGLRCAKEYWIEKFGPLYISPRLTIEPPGSRKPPSFEVDEESDEEESLPGGQSQTNRFKLGNKRSALYTTSRICLR